MSQSDKITKKYLKYFDNPTKNVEKNLASVQWRYTESTRWVELLWFAGIQPTPPNFFFSLSHPPTVSPATTFNTLEHNWNNIITMTRGNQRDNDRAKALKKAGNTVRPYSPPLCSYWPFLQKSKNTLSGSEFARSKEDAAAIMREKQRKGMCPRRR